MLMVRLGKDTFRVESEFRCVTLAVRAMLNGELGTLYERLTVELVVLVVKAVELP